MATELLDGTYVQAGIAGPFLIAEVSSVAQQGVVLAAYPQDHPDNLLGFGLEYDVLLASRHVLRCRSTFSRTGRNNGIDVPLKETKGTTDGTPYNLDVTPLDKMDGDHVFIEFPYDDAQQPYITRRLPHPSTQMAEARKNDADKVNRVYFVHEETEVYVDSKGNFVINTKASSGRTISLFTENARVVLSSDKVQVDVDGGAKRVLLEAGSGGQVLLENGSTSVKVTSSDVTTSATSDVLIDGGLKVQVSSVKEVVVDGGFKAQVKGDEVTVEGGQEVIIAAPSIRAVGSVLSVGKTLCIEDLAVDVSVLIRVLVPLLSTLITPGANFPSVLAVLTTTLALPDTSTTPPGTLGSALIAAASRAQSPGNYVTQILKGE